MMSTHIVTNQVPPLVDFDAADQPVVLEALRRGGAEHALAELHEVGRLAGSAHAQELGDLAEEHQPVLNTHDRYGHRIDEVRYDPAYHELMRHAVGFGLHGTPWDDTRPAPHLVRAAKLSVWGQVDAGHGCPISMTYAVVPALRANPELAARYEPLLTSRVYDPVLAPPTEKAGLLAGMSMTEKQGGSDVRANTTSAVPQPDGTYRITGHKWFTSAPMCDFFLVLAQAPGGLSCFFVPRVLPDGTRNTFRLQRLKNKLGNHSNASSEVEYDDTVGWLVGDEGRGVPTIIEMVNLTRLDCTLGSATAMRAGAVAAIHHAMHRRAFGASLVDQPLMRNVLADLVIEAEGASTVALWLAELTDRAVTGDEQADLLRRISLAVSKYYVCKRGPIHAAEALECLGGNGYVEDSRMPRLYREAPLMSVWEGSGNVAALDTLRAMAKQPAALGAFLDEVKLAAGADAELDGAIARLESQFTDFDTAQHRARRIVGDMALVLQGSLLVRFGHPAVADGFTRTRLGRDRGDVFGTLPVGLDTGAIIDRLTPKLG
ncbi:acyl-CoA dehydrogenase family protein [Nocardia cyriacigeorgica]|uniref:acyl-CoA dehydrogenase family protein n=1 Tax=Nocardia cyriacigeorgica TaxID=135487 RepID=UPI0018955ED1|nr:acyl-CoA dehydrogenase family protein [Nocardia cyriacigeorgica]MBF6435319.1 acyl-CoA dehydrogenase family protein [Nocardia cyriacigeorgica]MBF6454600.1 acyl-CoA dehydrogenase family protein [Nocardia cyriacigeorgica]MBF6479681.1 acyl-CoA dehydrogenase family protein [Nocardia cyriacigeorgica]MBF6552494.1 acyl-CoA dehydrogenase family protein [Nocardia cyriacigeorgica]